MRREHLEEIAEVVREHNLLVLSDEIYGELTYGKRKPCLLCRNRRYERTHRCCKRILQNVRYDRLETWICGWPS